MISIALVMILGFIGLLSGYKSKNKWLMLFSILPIALALAQLFFVLNMTQ